MEAVAVRLQAVWRGRKARAQVAAMRLPWEKQGEHDAAEGKRSWGSHGAPTVQHWRAI